jgi:hypothetical protein
LLSAPAGKKAAWPIVPSIAGAARTEEGWAVGAYGAGAGEERPGVMVLELRPGVLAYRATSAPTASRGCS